MAPVSRLPAPPTKKPALLHGLLALWAPHRFAEPLAQADHQAELTRNAPLRESSPESQLEHLHAARQAVPQRLRMLRRALLGSAASMATAVAVAWVFRNTSVAPMLPRPTLAVGSVFCFAVATLGRLGWGVQSIMGDTSVERLDQRLFHILYWIGMCWGALAIL